MEGKGILERKDSLKKYRSYWKDSVRNFGIRKRPRQQHQQQQAPPLSEDEKEEEEIDQEEVLRRKREAMLATSPLRPSMIALYDHRELRFVEDLPLKAPIAREHVCGVCMKHECECEAESDDESDEEEEEEELSQSCHARFLRGIRLKTDVVRNISGRIVNDQGFQMFIVVLILLNSLVIGIATFDAIEDNPDASRAFRILDLTFLVIFTIELIMQFLYHGYNLFFDGWLLFDLFIVLTSWTLESVSVLRALKLRSFRIFRAFRLTTRIRALRRLVQAIFDVMPKITAIIIMFSLVMYVFGVMCTELFGDIDYRGRFTGEDQLGEYDYFSRLDYSIFTLFVMVTLDWAKVARATMQVYPWSWAIFSTFVTFSSFVLYNLIIAVVCDAVKMVQDKQDILMVENYVKDKIESRHRIINLRQKLDKMSKQQMDLLLYVKLMLEQLDGIDVESKQHYEETLLLLGRTSGNAKEVLINAIQKLDEIDAANGLDGPMNGTAPQAPKKQICTIQEDSSLALPSKGGRTRKVSFRDACTSAPLDSDGFASVSTTSSFEKRNHENEEAHNDHQEEIGHEDSGEDASSVDEKLVSTAAPEDSNFLERSDLFDDSEVFASTRGLDNEKVDNSENSLSASASKVIDNLETTFKDEVSAIQAELENLQSLDGSDKRD